MADPDASVSSTNFDGKHSSPTIIDDDDGHQARPSLARTLSELYNDAWDSHHVMLPCSPQNKFHGNGKMRSMWYLISDVLSTEIAHVEELQEAIQAMNPTIDQRAWDFSGLVYFFEEYLPRERSTAFFRYAPLCPKHI